LYEHPYWTAGWSYLLISGFGLFLLRDELLIAILVFSIVLFALKNKNSTYLLIFSSPIWLSFSYTIIKLSSLEYLFSPRRLAQVRYFRGSRHNDPERMYMFKVDWENWLDVFTDMFILGMKFLFSPITINHSLEWFVITMDAIFIVSLVSLSILWITTPPIQEKKSEIIWIAGIVVLSLGIGLVEYSATGAPRHRMPLVMILLPVVTTAIAKFVNKRFRFIWHSLNAGETATLR
jgi:hypothetical protein